ncbi:MAG: YigZ family protein [Aerococcus sp.]|nr:YigZ family protein [Aerococcus sp.]
MPYRTIKQTGEFQIEIKKSIFICSMARVTDEAGAEAFIQQIKSDHYKATHHTFAYMIGENNEIQRMSDDGEPSGTAGVPMLEALKNMDLKNVVAVVTRYFGGKKLGAGGLIRAYSNAVSEACHHIGIVSREIQSPVAVTIDYPLTGQLEHWIELHDYPLLDTEYMENVTYTLGVDVNTINDFKVELVDFTSDNIAFKVGNPKYVDIPVAID